MRSRKALPLCDIKVVPFVATNRDAEATTVERPVRSRSLCVTPIPVFVPPCFFCFPRVFDRVPLQGYTCFGGNMSKLYYENIKVGTCRQNYNRGTRRPKGVETKLMFLPEKRLKGTPYYVEAFSVSKRKTSEAPNLKAIIEQQIKDTQ